MKLYTGYTQGVDNVLVGVYSYTQAKSYIRVRMWITMTCGVDNFVQGCSGLTPSYGL